MSHFKTVCRECGKVVAQCRCPDPNKTVIETVCDECREKEEGDRLLIDPPKEETT